MTDPAAPFRFVHASDLHLGRRFATLPEEIRGRLQEARHGALGRLAGAARGAGAAHVLLAGDVFDSETPSDPVWRQALAAMAAEADVTWWLLPGNHDSLAAETLWERIARQAPGNVRPVLTPEPRGIAPGAVLLPAPATRRNPGRDLTEWMDAAETPEGALRLGLAHGAVQDFGEDGGAGDVIAPDRAARARLDYLALGDWHGRLRIGPRTWYSGAPERDRFKHDGRGECLLVALAGPGAAPEVTPVTIGVFDWSERTLPLLPGEDAAAALAGALSGEGARRDRLLQVRATGRAGLAERAALEAAAAAAEPEFGFLALDLDDLAVEAAPGDLDEIEREGALRATAEALLAEAEDPAAPEETRAAARGALARLFGLLREVA